MWLLFCCSCAVGGLTFAAFFLIVSFFVLVTVAAAMGTMWLCGLVPSEHPIAALAFVGIFALGWWAVRTVNEQVRYRREVFDWMHWTVRKGWQARVVIWCLWVLAVWSVVWHTNHFAQLV